MVYFLISAVFLYLGINYKKNPYFFLFILGCLPFSNSFATFFYKNGLYAYDFYFFAVSACLVIDFVFYGFRFKHNYLLLPMLIVTMYSIFSIVSVDLNKYYLRDFRVLIFIFEFYIVLQILKVFENISLNKWILLIVCYSLTNVVYVVFSIFGIVAHEDLYYSNNGFRYFDLSTYCASIFFMLSPILGEWRVKGRYFNIAVLLAFSSVLVSGSRTQVLLSLAVFSFFYFSNIKRVVLGVLLFIPLVFLMIGFSDFELVSRLSNISFDVINEHLYIRFSPFFDIIDSFHWYNYLIGQGFGTTFFIPWFEYRSDYLDPYNNFIDTTFLTLYVKFGLLSLVIIVSYLLAIKKIIAFDQKVSWVMLIYIICLMLVFALPYQASSIGLIIGFLMIRCMVFKSHNSYSKLG